MKRPTQCRITQKSTEKNYRDELLDLLDETKNKISTFFIIVSEYGILCMNDNI